MDGGVAVTPSMGSTKSGGSGGDEPPNPEQIDKMLKRASEVTVTDELAWDDSWADLVTRMNDHSVPVDSGKEGLPMANPWTDAHDQAAFEGPINPPGLHGSGSSTAATPATTSAETPATPHQTPPPSVTPDDTMPAPDQNLRYELEPLAQCHIYIYNIMCS